MGVAKKLLATQKASGEQLGISDVFSTYVYEGKNSTQEIVNGINLADEGGMVWIKRRDYSDSHGLFDSERGVLKRIESDNTGAEYEASNTLTSYNNNGFTQGTSWFYNEPDKPYVSWTFRKAPRFFDVVTYTGNGVAGREIAHNLGCEPGMIVVKATSAFGSWRVYHRSLTATDYVLLNTTQATSSSTLSWNDTEPTSSVFTVGVEGDVNSGDREYVAYLFAHNETDGLVEGDGKPVIKCGSYTGNGIADGPEIDLGFEPQYVMIKAASTSGGWLIFDCVRGVTSGGIDEILWANLDNSGNTLNDAITFTPNGFKIEYQYDDLNNSGGTHVYLAIARETEKVPESSDEVFAIDTRYSPNSFPSFRSNFVPDMTLRRDISGTDNTDLLSRLTGTSFLETNTTDAEGSNTNNVWDFMDGWETTAIENSNIYSWMWKRAKGFFDVVTYEGEAGGLKEVPHNLGVKPEMLWVKNRDQSDSWKIYSQSMGATKYTTFSDSFGFFTSSYYWNDTEPTDAIFTVGVNGGVNGIGENLIAYLFASKEGISKCGSYTGNGTSQAIDAGFTTGVKFLIIKRSDEQEEGQWVMVDVVRGLDNFISLSNTNAQASGSGISADVSGFTVTQNATTDLNASGGSYIYYCIAN